jgi:hypothetical protein
MSADEQGYNGWKNYETWAMALWIDNDQGSYTYSREIVATEVEEGPEGLDLRTTAGRVADMLKDWQEECMYQWEPGFESTVFTDLLHAAFGEVDWYEIAQNYLSELAEA